MQEVIEGVQSALHQPEPEQTQEVIQHLANNAAQQQLMPQMMSQMMQLLQQMPSVQQQLQSQSTASTVTSSSTSSSSRRRCHRTNISFYCWSHGACAHPSPECKNKRPGHQDAATFENKMGGSVAFCRPVNDGITAT